MSGTEVKLPESSPTLLEIVRCLGVGINAKGIGIFKFQPFSNLV